MPEFTVHFQQNAGTSVRVEAEDYDAAIEKAYDELPGGLCAQCSGWGNPPGVDLAGDWEPYSVWSADDVEVWSEKVD